MLKKLQHRWKVNGWNLLLVIATFALGGSLCGYAGRKLLLMTGLEKGMLWVASYIIIVTLLWPICVLLVSVPLGQFSFFRRYIIKILFKMGGKEKISAPEGTTRMAIFASGAGSNANNIIGYFKNNPRISINLIVCNNPAAGVIQVARNHSIPLLMIDKKSLEDPGGCLKALQNEQIDLIILAGFLWKLPAALIQAFPKKIINIHPALLPSYGGKGMYGQHVHEAVIAKKDTQSGITIHLADEIYDHGEILFQETCLVEPSDTPESLAQKIHQLEHKHFPKVIESYLEKQNSR